jgi:hypothetical protein
MTSEFSQYNYSSSSNATINISNQNNLIINQTNFLSFNNTYNDNNYKNPYDSKMSHTWYVIT